MPTTRHRVSRGGGMAITPKAVELYRTGMAMSRRNHQDRDAVSRELARELRADVCLPCLLEREPVFLLAPPLGRDGEFVATWAEIKAALEAAA